MTGLEALPERGFRFTAVPPKIAGMRRLLLEAAATMTYGLGGDPKPLERALKDNEPFPARQTLLKEKR